MQDEDAIRERAYHLWEAAGRPPHGERDFWAQAQREHVAVSRPSEQGSKSKKAGATKAVATAAAKPSRKHAPNAPAEVAKAKSGSKAKTKR